MKQKNGVNEMSLVLLLIGLHFPCFLSEFFMQDLSYNLGRVRAKEQLLKSVLLYSFDQEQATSITNQCYQDVKEQNTHNQCPLCPSSHHSVNFLFHTDRRRKWVEVIFGLIQCKKALFVTSGKLYKDYKGLYFIIFKSTI